jgi:uncharacterized RDD family membrane protein YckC
MSEKYFDTISGEPAGFFTRIVAFFIDLFLVTFVILMSGVVIFLVLQFFRFRQILNFIQSLMPEVQGQIPQFIFLISPLIFLMITFYFVFFWTLVGFTPGKAIFGLRIVRRDGRPISFGRALLRFLGYWVSAIPFFLGFIWILISRRHEGWHDKLADTHVIYYSGKLLDQLSPPSTST